MHFEIGNYFETFVTKITFILYLHGKSNDPNAKIVNIDAGVCTVFCNKSEVIWTDFSQEGMVSESSDGIQICRKKSVSKSQKSHL